MGLATQRLAAVTELRLNTGHPEAPLTELDADLKCRRNLGGRSAARTMLEQDHPGQQKRAHQPVGLVFLLVRVVRQEQMPRLRDVYFSWSMIQHEVGELVHEGASLARPRVC